MRIALALLAVTLLSGCVTFPVPYVDRVQIHMTTPDGLIELGPAHGEACMWIHPLNFLSNKSALLRPKAIRRAIDSVPGATGLKSVKLRSRQIPLLPVFANYSCSQVSGMATR